MMELKIGDKAPSFRLKNQDDLEISSQDFGSKTIVLYFYPKDNTSGCSIEAIDFTSLLGEFASKGAVVIGISPDSPKSHKKFIADKALKHILLSDPDKSVASAYGAYGKKMMYGKEVFGIIRSTFVISPDGYIRNAFYNVRAKGHASKVLESLS
ncbi:peroxiredoxin [Helicobacter sp. 12S02634-8]|uniref:peroxiredoxin n=1 Tax=Helicobacter sp. 12S02634-8 TaxID=1476199 RepID=UPI000BCC2D8A|nr:peroxiredoxin [Helicobacter sp. 12S02634-8]PAF47996.1 peroxiredoxin [Helicobacter sp. 12S02634-8]